MNEKQNEQLSNDQCNADARGSFHDLPAKVGIVVGQPRAFIRAFHLGSNACTGPSFAVVRPETQRGGSSRRSKDVSVGAALNGASWAQLPLRARSIPNSPASFSGLILRPPSPASFPVASPTSRSHPGSRFRGFARFARLRSTQVCVQVVDLQAFYAIF